VTSEHQETNPQLHQLGFFHFSTLTSSFIVQLGTSPAFSEDPSVSAHRSQSASDLEPTPLHLLITTTSNRRSNPWTDSVRLSVCLLTRSELTFDLSQPSALSPPSPPRLSPSPTFPTSLLPRLPSPLSLSSFRLNLSQHDPLHPRSSPSSVPFFPPHFPLTPFSFHRTDKARLVSPSSTYRMKTTRRFGLGERCTG